ncbi:hypothetical protein M3J09_002818 [Ascochyta lentis]
MTLPCSMSSRTTSPVSPCLLPNVRHHLGQVFTLQNEKDTSMRPLNSMRYLE